MKRLDMRKLVTDTVVDVISEGNISAKSIKIQNPYLYSRTTLKNKKMLIEEGKINERLY